MYDFEVLERYCGEVRRSLHCGQVRQVGLGFTLEADALEVIFTIHDCRIGHRRLFA